VKIVIALGLFICVVLLIEGLYFAYESLWSKEAKSAKRRVRKPLPKKIDVTSSDPIDIERKKVLSGIPVIHHLLTQVSFSNPLHRLLEQADSKFTVGAFTLLSTLAGITGFVFCYFLGWNTLIALSIGSLCAGIPTILLLRKRKKRLWQFERQLPEALELIARALRAGHSLMIGMQMVSEEYPDPIGMEFDRTVQEISFGVSTEEAMNNFCRRVGSEELRFFVTALMVQWEIGGNLTEILDTISDLIRQRFELLGKVQAISAEGRLSVIVLFALPPLLALAIYIINEAYLMTLVIDPIGQIAAGVALTLMFLGVIVSKKMINIEV
jgi:tight adherence protein B